MLAGVGRIGRIGGAGTGSSAGVEAFISVWATTVVDETITIPCQNAGTFNAVVDWGDSSPPETITTYTGFTHVYSAIGEHTISITGVFPNIYLANGTEKLKIKKVLNLGTVGWTQLNLAFYGCSNLTEFTAGSTDTSNVLSMASMFQSCTGLTSLDVSTFNTSSVTDINNMLRSCVLLASVDVSSFVTSSATRIDGMFRFCNGLTSIVGAEDFDITGINVSYGLTGFLSSGKMTTAQYDNLLIKWRAQDPFNGMTPSFGVSTYTGGSAAATARQELGDIDGWSISDGGIEPSAFISVWATTGAFETITIPCQNIGTFNAVIDWGDGTPTSTITTYNDADLAHEYAAIGEHTISITGVFPNIYFNNVAADRLKIKRVTNLGTVGWINLNGAFFGCSNLTQFTTGSTDTSAVLIMRQMFHSCSALTSLDVSSFDTSIVTNMYAMFYACSALTSLDVSSFDTSNVSDMGYMLGNCSALTSMVGVEDFDITGLNSTGDLTGFITNGKMTTAQYDNLLINWEAQAAGIPAMTPSFGTSTYTSSGAAETAHAALNDVHGWVMGDSGSVPSPAISMYDFDGSSMYATMPAYSTLGNPTVYRDIQYSTSNRDGFVIDTTEPISEFGRVGANYHNGTIQYLTITDRSPIQDTSVVMGNDSVYATVPTITLANDFEIEFDMIRQDTASGASNSFILSKNVGTLFTCRVYDTGHASLANNLRLVSGGGLINFTAALAGVANGQHVNIKFTRVSNLNTCYVDGVAVGGTTTVGGNIVIDTLMIHPNRSTTPLPTGCAIQNLRLTAGGLNWFYPMNEGTGTTLANIETGTPGYNATLVLPNWASLPTNSRLYVANTNTGSSMVDILNAQDATIQNYQSASWINDAIDDAALKAIWNKPAGQPILLVMTGQSNALNFNTAANPMAIPTGVYDFGTAGASPPQVGTPTWLVPQTTNAVSKQDFNTAAYYTGYAQRGRGNAAIACAARLHVLTGRTVYIVQVSKASTFVDDWTAPSGIGDLLNQRVTEALATSEMTTAGITAPDLVMWLQGESGSLYEYADYLTIWNTWRNDAGASWTASTPFYVYDFAQEWNWEYTDTYGAPRRRDTMRYVADNGAAPVTLIPSLGVPCESGGEIHFTGDGANEMGFRFAEFTLYDS